MFLSYLQKCDYYPTPLKIINFISVTMTTVWEVCEVWVCDIRFLCADVNKLYTYLSEHNLVKLNTKCANCESVLGVNIPLRNFRCDKQQRVTKNKRSKIERRRFYVSALKGTFFERSHLKLSEIFQIPNILFLVSILFLFHLFVKTLKSVTILRLIGITSVERFALFIVKRIPRN